MESRSACATTGAVIRHIGTGWGGELLLDWTPGSLGRLTTAKNGTGTVTLATYAYDPP